MLVLLPNQQVVGVVQFCPVTVDLVGVRADQHALLEQRSVRAPVAEVVTSLCTHVVHLTTANRKSTTVLGKLLRTALVGIGTDPDS